MDFFSDVYFTLGFTTSMDTFIKSASTPEWWISIVFVGIAINLTSSALHAILQKQFGRFVKSWAERNEVLASERAIRIGILSNSTHELYLAHLNLNQKRLDNIFDWVLAAVLLGFGAAAKDFSPFAYSAANIFAMFSAMQGLISLTSYWQEALLVQEAKFENLSKMKSPSPSKQNEPSK